MPKKTLLKESESLGQTAEEDHLSSLPKEILSVIFLQLSLMDWFNMRLVSRWAKTAIDIFFGSQLIKPFSPITLFFSVASTRNERGAREWDEHTLAKMGLTGMKLTDLQKACLLSDNFRSALKRQEITIQGALQRLSPENVSRLSPQEIENIQKGIFPASSAPVVITRGCFV